MNYFMLLIANVSELRLFHFLSLLHLIEMLLLLRVQFKSLYSRKCRVKEQRLHGVVGNYFLSNSAKEQVLCHTRLVLQELFVHPKTLQTHTQTIHSIQGRAAPEFHRFLN